MYAGLTRTYRDVGKHLVDIDEAALAGARAELGTATINETVNVALARASDQRRRRVDAALEGLARATFADRDDAWR